MYPIQICQYTDILILISRIQDKKTTRYADTQIFGACIPYKCAKYTDILILISRNQDKRHQDIKICRYPDIWWLYPIQMCQISTPFLQIAAHQLNGTVGFPLTFRCWEKTTHFAQEPKQINQCIGFNVWCCPAIFFGLQELGMLSTVTLAQKVRCQKSLDLISSHGFSC